MSCRQFLRDHADEIRRQGGFDVAFVDAWGTYDHGAARIVERLAGYHLLAPRGAALIVTFCDRGRPRGDARRAAVAHALAELRAALGAHWSVRADDDLPRYGRMQCIALRAADPSV